jgi:hypothetical protein
MSDTSEMKAPVSRSVNPDSCPFIPSSCPVNPDLCSITPVPKPKSGLGNSVLVSDLHSVTQGCIPVSSFIDHVPVNSVSVPSSASARYPVPDIPEYLPQEVFYEYNRSIQSSQNNLEKIRRTKSSDAQNSVVDIKKKHKSVTFGPVSYIPDVQPPRQQYIQCKKPLPQPRICYCCEVIWTRLQ